MHHLTPRFILGTLAIGVLYVLFAIYLLNIQLVIETFTFPTTLSHKAQLFLLLPGGLFTAFPPFDALLLVLTGILFGGNSMLLSEFFKKANKGAKVSVTAGAGLGLAATGCAACGFSLLSIVGISWTTFTFPFSQTLIQFLSIALLIFSFLYMLHQHAQSCSIKSRENSRK